ncbi:MAG: ABC transporter permease, partial [Clostridiales bacterium]|nr:ABC transporter permease [Clostridiales bacterium]
IYTDYRNTKFTEKEYEDYVKSYEGAIPMISYRGNNNISNLSISGAAQMFYSTNISGMVPASDKLRLLAGRMPTAADEVAITDFIFDAGKASGSKFVYGENNTQLTINSYQDILWSEDKPITAKVDDEEYKIVGVFKGMNVPDNYASLKQAADNNESTDMGYSAYTWSNERDNGLYMTVAVAPEVFREAAFGGGDIDYNYAYFKSSMYSANIRVDGKSLNDEVAWSKTFQRFAKYEDRPLELYGFDGKKITSLGNGEGAVSALNVIDAMYECLYDVYYYVTFNDEYRNMLGEAYQAADKEYRETYPEPDSDEERFYDFEDGQLEAYNAAHAQYVSSRNEYIQQIIADGHPEGSEEYETLLSEYDEYHWEPNKINYGTYNSDRFHQALLQYLDDVNAYVDAEVNKARVEQDVKYQAVLKRLADAVEAEYRAQNPEPKEEDYDTYGQWNDAHNEWLSGLDTAVHNNAPLSVLGEIVDGKDRSLEKYVYAINYVLPLLDEIGIPLSFVIQNDTESPQQINIVGFFTEEAHYSCYLGDDLYNTFYTERTDYYENREQTKYRQPKDAYINNILIPYDGSRAVITQLLDKSGARQDDDSAVKIKNAIVEQLDMIIDTADTLEMAFMIAGAVFALFAFLLMFNFISASITAKKKDIGILRAIGARTTDVFKIFMSEALIIAVICFAISALGAFGLCMLLNSIIIKDVGLSVSIFVFGPLSILCVLGIALLTALISTVIPVSIYSRKPPIASIRAL